MDLIPTQFSDQSATHLMLNSYLKLEAIESNYKVFHKILLKIVLTSVCNPSYPFSFISTLCGLICHCRFSHIQFFFFFSFSFILGCRYRFKWWFYFSLVKKIKQQVRKVIRTNDSMFADPLVEKENIWPAGTWERVRGRVDF